MLETDGSTFGEYEGLLRNLIGLSVALAVLNSAIAAAIAVLTVTVLHPVSSRGYGFWALAAAAALFVYHLRRRQTTAQRARQDAIREDEEAERRVAGARLIQNLVTATNARNSTEVVRCYRPHALVLEDRTGSTKATGANRIQALYDSVFKASPNLIIRVATLLQVGSYAITKEIMTGLAGKSSGPEKRPVAIYRVDGDAISSVRILD